MSVEDSVSRWIDGLRRGDEVSAQDLWNRYFERLVEYAGRKLPRHARRDFDEEDVALSAFHSLCEGVRQGRFPALADRNDLWSLLVVITARKASHRLRDNLALKRGGGKVKGESVFGAGADGPRGLDELIGSAPSPEFAVEVAEESERLLALLEDESLRSIALLRVEGYTVSEIGERLGCGRRTVERRLQVIRELWAGSAERTDID